MKNYLRHIGICCSSSALALASLVACSADECLDNHSALPLADFFSSANPVSPVSLDSVVVCGIGAPGDSVLSPASARPSQLFLPFRIDSDTTVYSFRDAHAGSKLSSTVTFIYSRTPRFASAECGVSYVFDIRDIKIDGLMIDSVVCPTGFIDNTNITNLHIYFDPGLYSDYE